MNDKPRFKTRAAVAVGLAVAVVATAGALFACSPKANPGVQAITKTAPTYIPEADSFGVIDAASWADQYPNEYNTYLDNALNTPLEVSEITDEQKKLIPGIDRVTDMTKTDKVSYLETNPEIKTLGKGYGYAKYYTEPAGHVYSLWTVQNNGRVNDKTKITCYACKTPQYNVDNDTLGNAQYKRAFSEGTATYTEPISCANCHVNTDPTQLSIGRANWVTALGSDINKVPMESAVCGQCHCDYSMAPSTYVNPGMPTSPYTGGLLSMTPEAALKFYDDNNFVDWTYESTGAKMLAVRHAEFEFCYVGWDGSGNHMTSLGYTCSTCHMAKETDSSGKAYTSHNWTDPLDNEELIKNDCSTCHKDIKAEVKAWQTDIDGRTQTLGQRCENFIHNFENAISAGSINDDQKAELQKLQRYACYYWNLAAAENSEGAHNPTYYNQLLNKGNELCDQADSILGVSSVVAS